MDSFDPGLHPKNGLAVLLTSIGILILQQRCTYLRESALLHAANCIYEMTTITAAKGQFLQHDARRNPDDMLHLVIQSVSENHLFYATLY